MHWLQWTGVIVIAFGTILTIIGQQKTNNLNNKLIQEKSDKITEMSQENIRLSEKIVELSKQSINQITGGDSWAYVSSGLHSKSGVPNQPFGLKLNHVGDNPLHDLIIEISEVEYSTGSSQKSYTLKQIFNKEVGTLSKSIYSEPLGILELPNKNRAEYKVKLKARNGEIMQHWIFIKREGNYWSTAMKVVKFKPNKDGGFSKVNLYEKIDDGFPDTNLVWLEF